MTSPYLDLPKRSEAAGSAAAFGEHWLVVARDPSGIRSKRSWYCKSAREVSDTLKSSCLKPILAYVIHMREGVPTLYTPEAWRE